MYALRVARQYAEAFNQRLSFDTSKVTTMETMFMVRFTRARAPSLKSGSPNVGAAWAAAPSPPVCQPAHLTPHRYSFRMTRQAATAFNQPLSFDTSSVTGMSDMFAVCTPPVPCAQTPVGLSPILEMCPPLHTRTAPVLLPRISPSSACAPLLIWHRTHLFCPTPTSSSSSVRGRAARPSVTPDTLTVRDGRG